MEQHVADAAAKLAEMCRNERIQQALTQAEVARRAGLRPQTVNEFETGATRPSLDTLLRITGVLRLNMVATDKRLPYPRLRLPGPERERILKILPLLQKLNRQQLQIILDTVREFVGAQARRPKAKKAQRPTSRR